MKKLTTKGEAAYLVLGEPVTDANRVKCKAIINSTPFDVVYTPEKGKSHPIAIGKVVAERDPFSYLPYPETPPPQYAIPPDSIEQSSSSVPDENQGSALSDVNSSKLSKY